MGFFESLFYTIWRGIAIGILISAPMGPVGILCIQRTLNKGRKSGLYTGIGAAISDLFYCILTGFGLSFIEEFLERNQNIIQLVGSVVLIAFAIYLFKKNPASSLKTPQGEEEHVSPHKNILGGFLFTFSNPLILFLIIGLFARFNFSIPEISFYYYIAGYIAIFVGAVIWWEFVTFSVNKLRAHFNLRSMWLINRIIGVIILLFALVGIVTGVTNIASAQTFHWNQGRGYGEYKYATPEGIKINNATDSLQYDYHRFSSQADEMVLKFRARNLHGDPAKRYGYRTGDHKEAKVKNPQWGFFVTYENDTLLFRIRNLEKTASVETEPGLEIAIYRNGPVSGSDGFKELNLMATPVFLTRRINPYTGDNLWEIRADKNQISINGGDHSINNILQNEAGKGEITGFGFFSGWGGNVLFSDISLELKTHEERNISADYLSESQEYFAESKDEMEGYWTMFDRELEESLLKPGGNYRLACVREGEGYNLIYLEGAVVNSNEWKSGDIKARLLPTPFEDIYDVEWYDSMKDVMKHDIRAQKGEGNTLTIQFPYQSSKVRLRRIPD